MTDAQLDDLRRRIDLGEPVTNEELIAGLNAIRQVRLNAPTAAAKGKTPAIGPMKIDLAALIKKQQNPA